MSNSHNRQNTEINDNHGLKIGRGKISAIMPESHQEESLEEDAYSFDEDIPKQFKDHKEIQHKKFDIQNPYKRRTL